MGEVAAGGVERVYAEPVGRSVPLGGSYDAAGGAGAWDGSMARRRVVAESQPSAPQRQEHPRASGPFASHLALVPKRPRRIFLSRAIGCLDINIR